MNQHSFQLLRRSGSAIITALGFAFVLMIIFGMLFSYSSARIQNTIIESQMMKALAMAETGMQCATAELYQDPSFETHDLGVNQVWGAKKAHSNYLADCTNLKFKVTSGTNGTYCGTFGEGEFAVRVGSIKYEDNAATKNINEKNCFVKIESMGKIPGYVKTITAIVQRRFPAREFCMFDGGVLSIVYGLANKPSQYNIFKTGHFYGHLGVEIGDIQHAANGSVGQGTGQKFDDIELISSGLGGVYFYDSRGTEIKFRGGTTVSVPQNVNPSVFLNTGDYPPAPAREGGSFPRSLAPEAQGNSIAKALPVGVKGKIVDRSSGATPLPPIKINPEVFKKAAQTKGKIVSGTTTRKTPIGGTEQVTMLDFGTDFHAADPTSLGAVEGSTFYSDQSIVIKGNPPVPMTIFSAKNVYVAGDFNQKTIADGKFFDQRYATNPEEDSDYVTTPGGGKDQLDKDVTLTDPAKRFHQPVKVVALERILFDYRSPVDCFENELFPFLKHQIALKLASGTQPVPLQNFIAVTPNSGMTLKINKASASAMLASFTSTGEYDLMDPGNAGVIAAAGKLPGDDLTDAVLTDVAKDLWKEYRVKYEAKETLPQFGVYKLLKDEFDKYSTLTPTQKETLRIRYPEMTTNGMFISCAIRNATFYAGPNVTKHFDDIGNAVLLARFASLRVAACCAMSAAVILIDLAHLL